MTGEHNENVIEELANGITHGIGLALSIVGLVVLTVLSIFRGNAWHIAGCTTFGVTLVLLYTASTLYHTFHTPRLNRILKILDHAAIYLLIAGTYNVPRFFNGASSFASKVLSWLGSDWQIGGVLRYASGFPFRVPASTTNLNALIFQNTLTERVPGEPLFATTWVDKKGVTHTDEELDINCGCYDPKRTFVLNPKAWRNPPDGKFSVSNSHYSDFRQQRRPSENFSIARRFRISERANFMLRGEFTNIFNRTGVNVPSVGNPFSAQTRDKDGFTTGGFGYISPAAVGGSNTNPAAAGAASFATPSPRSATIVARVQF